MKTPLEATMQPPAPPHPRRFYIYNTKTKAFEKIDAKSLTVEGMENFDLFIHGVGDELIISEGKTGGYLFRRSGLTKADMIAECAYRAERFSADMFTIFSSRIEAKIGEHGLSPRWTP